MFHSVGTTLAWSAFRIRSRSPRWAGPIQSHERAAPGGERTISLDSHARGARRPVMQSERRGP
jgi:hypothetical protein